MGTLGQKALYPAIFGFALLILIGIQIVTTNSLNQTIQSAEWIEHTHRVVSGIDLLSADLQGAETALLRYLITDDQQYLQDINTGIRDWKKQLNTIHDLTVDNPQQLQRETRLNSLIQQRIDLIWYVVDLRDKQGFSATQHAVLQGRGRKLMDLIQAEFDGMRSEEVELLRQRYLDLKIGRQWILLAANISFLFALAILTTGFILSNRLNNQLEQAVEERGRYAERLEKSNRELDRVATIASHDLKSPLRRIATFSGAISEDRNNVLTEESRDYFMRIEKNIIRMQDLIDELLTIARVKEEELRLERVDLRQIVQDALSNLEESLESSGGQVEVGPLRTVVCDKVQMTQLMQNLIENGLKYHQEGVPPKINVFASKPQKTGRDIDIHVRDNGIGIAPEQHEHIFEMFSRLHSEAKIPGTGIGLATVKQIVERHHGTIKLRSRIGQGSEFIIHLPGSDSV